MKIIIKYCLLLIISHFAFNSCSNDFREDKLESHFNTIASANKDIKLTKIDLEEVVLDSIVSSYLGEVSYRSDTIYFLDYRFCWVYIFTKEGDKISRVLGQGRSHKEIPTGRLNAHVPLDNYNHLFIGTSYDIYIFNSNWELISQQTLDWQIKNETTEKSLLEDPDPRIRGMHDLNDVDFFKPRVFKDEVYLPISSMHPKFDFLTSDYYKYARAMAKMDIKTAIITEEIGRRSPEYLKYKYLVLDFFCYDITKNGEIILNYPPDSLIYICSTDFEIKKAFSIAGKDMDMDYREIKRHEEEVNIWNTEITEKGYYSWIEYFDKQDLLFRSYTKGSHSKFDGLQIYKGDTMIGDVDVPKNFRVEGYIEPFFYSNEFIDEEKEEIKVYKFKLELR
jgi:hypothetical protein